jgi:hypothetical protein
MKRTGWIFVLILLALGPTLAPAQSGRVGVKELQNRIKAAQEAIREAGGCQERKEYGCVANLLTKARFILERLPEDARKSKQVQDWLWSVYTRLGLFSEARRLREEATPENAERWGPAWESMRSSYGTIRLETDDAVLRDRTLDVAAVVINPKLGGSTEFPSELVRHTAADRIRQAFQERDLLTDPITLPVGSHQVTLRLTRESGLNYKKPTVVIDFEVEPDSTVMVKIDPVRRKSPLALLGGLAVLLITPFVAAK